jgi:peptidoglycan/xylan/chitin deacetylase (PgdA/CDA1 family)
VLGARVICRRDDLAEDVVALTFDDGPAEWTVPILDTLAAARVKATFFVIGNSIVGRESTLRRIVSEGHEVGNHTFTHGHLLRGERTRADVAEDIESARRAISEACGIEPTVFRPPFFGDDIQTLETILSCGYKWSIHADVLTDDWNATAPEQITSVVVPAVTRGSIVDLHDGRPVDEPFDDPEGRSSRGDRWPTAHSVAQIVPALLERGFRFVTVSELLALPAR